MAKKKGLWDNIHAKRKRGESPAKKGDKNYPDTLDIGEGLKKARKNVGADTCWDGYKAKGTKKKDGKEVPNCVQEKTFAEISEIFGLGKKKETKQSSSWSTSNADALAKARFNNEVKAGNIQKGSTTKFNAKTNSTELVAPKRKVVSGIKYEAPKPPKAEAQPKAEAKPKSNPYSGPGKLKAQSFSTAVKAGTEMKSTTKEKKPKGKYSNLEKILKKTKRKLGISESMKTARKNVGADTCWDGYKAKGTKKKDGKEVPNCVKEGKSFAEFCAEGKSRIETDPEYRKRFKSLADNFAEKRKEQTSAKKTRKESVEILDVDGNMVAEITDLVSPEPMTGWKQQMDEAAWTRKEGKNKTGGLNEKGRKSYERENPGSNLQAPQPEGGPRKDSFCARMSGMEGPLKDEKGEPTRKKLALDKWKC